jgi:hypothetical protein
MEWNFSANRSSRKHCMTRSWWSHATELGNCGNSGDDPWSSESGRIWRYNNKCNVSCVFRDTFSKFFFRMRFIAKKKLRYLPNFLVKGGRDTVRNFVELLSSHGDRSRRINPDLVPWGLCDPSPLWLTFFFKLSRILTSPFTYFFVRPSWQCHTHLLVFVSFRLFFICVYFRLGTNRPHSTFHVI